jgi:hypothetical protein
MNNLFNTALVKHVGLHWNETRVERPEKSGAYQTRDDNNQVWIKYFDANYGLWYMSWAEMKANIECHTARISGAELSRHVVAWARRNEQGGYAYAVKQLGYPS